MISESTKRSLNEIFIRAVSSHLRLDESDQVCVQPTPAGQSPSGEQQLLLLTIAGFSFKLLVMFHLDARALQAYFSQPDSGRVFDEVFPELGNLCCGAINRDLARYFPHLGMSTPFRLDGRCFDYLASVRPAHVAHHRIAINGDIHLDATLCLCAYAPIDFQYVHVAPVVESGEIELF